MITSKITQISEALRGMSQEHAVGSNEPLMVGAQSTPVIFSRTYMASISGDFLFEIGSNVMDPVIHTRLLLQYAADQGVPVSGIIEEYLDLISSLGYSKTSFSKIIASLTGSADRAMRTNAVPTNTPIFIYGVVSATLPDDTPDLLVHMATDFVCHLLAPFGFVQKDAPFIYRLRQNGLFPTYDGLVDVIDAANIHRVLTTLAAADLSMVRSAMERAGSILPSLIVQHMSNAVVTAYELSQGAYQSASVVNSVLTTIARILDPQTPRELQPRERIRNNPIISELRSNLAIFLAIQDMRRKGVGDEVDFSDEEMTSVVLPLFSSSMAELSTYSIRLLDDVVSHISKVATRDHGGRPGNIIVYEDWKFDNSVRAFSRVRHTPKGRGVFLAPRNAITTVLSNNMKPVLRSLSMQKLVERRMAAYEMEGPSKRVPEDGALISIAMPSLIETELSYGLPLGAVSGCLRSGDFSPLTHDQEGVPGALPERFARQLAFDYYAFMMHLAVSRSPQVSVSFAETEQGSTPYAIWELRTPLRDPVGTAAIVNGSVFTTEPVETLAYVPDFQATSAREARSLPIEDFSHCLHLWDWHGSSLALEMIPSFPINIRNRNYNVVMTEHEILNLGVRSVNARFMRPIMAAAIVRVWMTWLTEDRKFIQDKIDATTDNLVRDSYMGLQIRQSIEMLEILSHISTGGAGENTKKKIRSRLAEQMRALGTIDDYTEMTVGVQNHRINVWAGLTVLQLLGLMTAEDASSVIDYLAEHNSLALVVGMKHSDVYDTLE